MCVVLQGDYMKLNYDIPESLTIPDLFPCHDKGKHIDKT